MDAVKEFFTKEISITDSFSVQTWMFFALAIAVILLVVIIVSAVKNSKKTASADETAKSEVAEEKSETYIPEEDEEVAEEEVAPADEPVEEEPAVAPVAEEAAEEEVAPAVEEAEEVPAVEEAPAKEEAKEEAAVEEAEEPATEPEVEEAKEEPAEEAKEEPALEVAPVAEEAKEEPAKEEAPAAEEAREEAPAAEEAKEEAAEVVKPAPKKKKAAPKKKAEVAPEKEEAKKEEPAPAKEEKVEAEPEAEVAATVDETEKKAKGKFELCNSVIGGYRYILRANNGQLLYESRDYKTVDGCRDAVSKFVNAVVNGEFKVRADKFGKYKFMLKSPTSTNVVYIGESFNKKDSALNNVESVKRFADVSPIVDMTEADFVAPSAVYEIPADVAEAVANGQGAVGKWEIVPSEPENEKSPYVYLLRANNGQLLYESRDYKTYDNCRSGAETFIKTVKDGTFIVDVDKNGRYKFILRSRKAGSQMEYYGQTYPDKTACMNNVISVYKFASLTVLPE